jgi:hypothetical protein
LTNGWDIVHLSGHGDEEGLWMEDGLGCVYMLKADELCKLLLHNHNLRLLVLSACYTDELGRKLMENLKKDGHYYSLLLFLFLFFYFFFFFVAEEPSATVCIVAMSGGVEDVSARLFCRNFYQMLGTMSVGDAFAHAQQVVSTSPVVAQEVANRVDDDEFQVRPHERFKMLGSIQISLEKTPKGDAKDFYIPDYLFPCNAPQSRNLLGRVEDLVELIKIFQKEQYSLINIFGEVGIGKTELSKAICWWLYDRFFPVVYWICSSQAPLDLPTLLDGLVAWYRIPVDKTATLDGRKAAVFDFLRRQSSLIAIDGFDAVPLPARAPLWSFLLSLPPSTKVLLTSREALPPAQVLQYTILPLKDKESAKLFWMTLTNAAYFQQKDTLSMEETKMIEQIGKELGGNPLAIVLVASRSSLLSLPTIKTLLQTNMGSLLEAKSEITNQVYGLLQFWKIWKCGENDWKLTKSLFSLFFFFKHRNLARIGEGL